MWHNKEQVLSLPVATEGIFEPSAARLSLVVGLNGPDLLFLNLLVFSESGPGILRGHGVNRQPAAQVPGHQPGHARPQRPVVLLHPLCFPAAQQ